MSNPDQDVRQPESLNPGTCSRSPESDSVEPATCEQGSRRSPRIRVRQWTFRLIAIAIPFAVLALVEASLRWSGVGESCALVIRSPHSADVLPFQFNAHSDQAYIAGRNLAGPETRRFDLPRPDDIYRIVVVGASTVQGFPYESSIAFPRQMEILLKHQASSVLPGRDVEVLNAGIVSINSFALVDVVRQVVGTQPDLIVLYAGHNEFYGPGGPSSNATRISGSLFPFLIRVRRQRLFQLLADFGNSESAQSERTLIESLPKELEIPIDGQVFRQGEANFRTNLQKILKITSDAGVPVLLTTVASNLRNQSPIRSIEPTFDVRGSRRKWQQFTNAATAAMKGKQWGRALQEVENAENAAAETAQTAWWKANCLLELGETERASESFVRARDLDGCRFRAPSSFQQISQKLAASGDYPNVTFLDVVPEMRRHATDGIPGDSLFLEHVHYTLHGHRVLATILSKAVVEKVLLKDWQPNSVPSNADLDRLLGIIPQDELAGLSIALETLKTAPLNGAVDVDRHIDRIVSRVKESFFALSVEDQNAFSRLTSEAMVSNLLPNLASSFAASKDWDAAIDVFRKSLVRNPTSVSAHLNLAHLLIQRGQQQEVGEILRRAQQLAPEDPQVADLLQLGQASKNSANVPVKESGTVPVSR